MTTDHIDLAAGLSPTSALHRLRWQRPEFVEGAEACRRAVLAPADDQGLDPKLRMALARRMALMNDDPVLAAQYEVDAEHAAIAEGGANTAEPLATILRHVDLVTKTPTEATEGDIRRLEAAGLTNPQIVALSELIAFVNFQTRIAAGLRLMGAA